MRTTFDNAMCAHVWAQRSQAEGRSKSMRFAGSTIYSYSTPIARFLDVKGVEVALVTSHTFSATTSGKHMPAVQRALGYSRPNVFRVPHVDPVNHAANLKHLARQYTDAIAKAERARDLYYDETGLRDHLFNFADTVIRYASLFDLPALVLAPEEDAAGVFAYRAAREAKNSTPAAIARREKAAAAREAKKARATELERLRSAERIAAWQAGEPIRLGYGETRDEWGGALLRVRGGNLETSLGASVPLAHAVKVFRFAKLCRERGEAWERNGRTLRVGHFQIDRVDPCGNFVAGCHTIRWPQIEVAAKAAGVWDCPAEDTRESN